MGKLTEGQINLLKELHDLDLLQDDVRIRMKTEFPDAFRKNILNRIKAVGSQCYGYPIEHNESYVFVMLPNTNSDWTLAAYDWVKRFCDSKLSIDIQDFNYPYPIHGSAAKRAIEEAIESTPQILSYAYDYIVISYH